ncbi:GPN-loop GTPase 2 [Mycena sanguinolenta]|uniref:GPN-loop GTPase 2 n=1 Tax=Mycena sanguinolenta TaxID=230812 RepID=A0A8H6ZFM7_9AGAR|nr:GPN-loop GTPase 2 [Mycena sanguinolenta]
MAMISLIEDFSLVGFKTLAGEDKSSMLHLMHTIDRASGYIFVPQATSATDPTIDASEATRPNASALFSSAAGLMRHDEVWDAFEKESRADGQAACASAGRIRERTPGEGGDVDVDMEKS